MEKTTAKRITKREMFEQIKANYALTDAEVAFIDHELELLNRKNASGGEKKLTAQQVANEGIKEVILEVLADAEEPMTITEMQKANAELGELQNQRVSALVRQLIDAERVIRTEVKGKARFSLV